MKLLCLSVFVPVLATLAYKLHTLHKDEVERRKQKPRVTDIRIYPVKSCRGISLTTGKVTELGFEHDREWLIIDSETRRFISQRQASALATVTPSFKGEYLCLDAPGMPTLKLPLAITKSASIEVYIWDDTVMAIEESEEAAQWFSKYLNKKVKVVRVDPNVKRIVDPEFWTEDIPGPKICSFADAYPFLMFSKESLKWLNENVPTEKTIELTRFRPSLVVEGTQGPFDEDTWATFYIRGIPMHVVKPCGRCKVTTIDQLTGEHPTGPEPLATLQRLRKYHADAIFGQNVVHETTGYIRVGDVVDVEHRKPPPTLQL
eukprot:Phypoly_transcript_13735.p1 GENE.Phypoly_transcript_13735~~Phypoly_transcript_13735.p1  ORF type:complete len:317 (-),score=33.89 Phypoly_transcript_13735:44-994(-)